MQYNLLNYASIYNNILNHIIIKYSMPFSHYEIYNKIKLDKAKYIKYSNLFNFDKNPQFDQEINSSENVLKMNMESENNLIKICEQNYDEKKYFTHNDNKNEEAFLKSILASSIMTIL